MVQRKNNKKNLISNVLPDLVQDRGWERQLDLHSIFPKWQDLVGEDMGKYARPQKIERGVLWLEVENSSWLQQFQYEKVTLLETLNDFLRITSLRDIKMVLPKGGGGLPPQETGPKVTFVRPSSEKVEAFRKQVECITDEKCREALMQFWYLAQACKREKK